VSEFLHFGIVESSCLGLTFLYIGTYVFGNNIAIYLKVKDKVGHYFIIFMRYESTTVGKTVVLPRRVW